MSMLGAFPTPQDSTAATVNELVLALGRAVASGSANRVVAIADQILELDPVRVLPSRRPFCLLSAAAMRPRVD